MAPPGSDTSPWKPPGTSRTRSTNSVSSPLSPTKVAAREALGEAGPTPAPHEKIAVVVRAMARQRIPIRIAGGYRHPPASRSPGRTGPPRCGCGQLPAPARASAGLSAGVSTSSVQMLILRVSGMKNSPNTNATAGTMMG